MRKKLKTENSRKYDAREKIVSYSMQTLKEPQKAKKQTAKSKITVYARGNDRAVLQSSFPYPVGRSLLR